MEANGNRKAGSVPVLVALGANLPSAAGDPASTLRHALHMMHACDEMSIATISRFWRSPAYPAGSGPDYINACAELVTTLPPEGVLAVLHEIEARLGRVRGARWGARVIDLDLLAHGETVLPDPATQDRWRALPPDRQTAETPDQLILPHPRMQDRAFVLLPLAEIAPDWRHPRLGATVAAMAAALDPASRAAMTPLRGHNG